ncbi:MAG: tetratricopeptide repeat protein [Candidatus Marinimicrobia bacterium]|nr:tetratricopeptide repeat protein [Candidatus Neomarinimicrobiota bacterium]
MPDSKRRLAAIMFTDIVGYTALMGRDEQLALNVLDRNREILKPIIESANGEWLKEIGDGTLSAFTSAVEAVQCALEIQASLVDDQTLTLRIGIHIGDVVFKDADVFGDGVNIASRLEPLADPGGICISERVFDDIRNQVDIQTRPLGQKNLKGISRPISVYALLLPGQGKHPAPAEEQRPDGEKPSIAVLPFVNMSADAENEYFCDGMTEELIDALAKVAGLKVVARTSAFVFKGQTIDIREIGQRLNVGKVLEGSVRKAGNRIRITAQLINVADGYHLWSEKYDRELEDVFAIQDEIARTVVESLKVRLTGSHKTQLVKQATDNMEAYTLWLKGNFEWYKQTPEGMLAAIDFYQQALKIDPQYAAAHANLAEVYVHLALYGLANANEAIPTAKKAAQQALEIDPDLAEGHGALASIALYYEWDWDLAEREFEKAVNLKINSPPVLLNYGQCHILLQKFESGRRRLDAALELDPLSEMVRTYHGFFLAWMGHVEEGIAELKETVLAAPNFHFSHHFLAILLALTGRLEESLPFHERARALADLPSAQMMHAHALGLAGKKDEAMAIINVLEAGAAQGQTWGFFVGVAYLGLGDYEKALDWLEKGMAERNPSMPFISLGLINEPVRDHPRFKAILKELGLKPVVF